MGDATEHLAHRTGPTVGGLLNATFGNAAELIIALMALRAGLVDLVKASITGSILGNLLLIMGLAIIAGGAERSELKFNRTNAGMSAGMLALSVVALAFPALYHAVHPEAAARAAELRMSEAVALILILTYGCSLLFTLRTHRRAARRRGPSARRSRLGDAQGGAGSGRGHRGRGGRVRAAGARRYGGDGDPPAVADVPRPHHHSRSSGTRPSTPRPWCSRARDRSISGSRSRSGPAPRWRCWWPRCWSSRVC